jgi:hypothetical protein
MLKTIILCLSLALLGPKFAAAQSSPDDIIKYFFERFKTDGSDKAVEFIFSTNKFYGDTKSIMDDVKVGLKKVIATSGQFIGYETLCKKSAGESLTMNTVMAKFEKGAFTFRIVFYKPYNIWQLENFKINNKMDDELEEASQAYRFKENIDN